MSRTLKALVEKVLNSEQIVLVYKKLLERMEQYRLARLQGRKSAAVSFQQLVDLEIEFQRTSHPEMNQKVSCAKSCFFCCEQKVHITEDEAEVLAEVVKDRGTPISIQKLKDQASWSGQEWGLKSREERRCTFIGEDGECLVYDHRPMSCRKLLSLDRPEFCDPRREEVPEMFVIPESEITSSAAFNICRSGSLPEMLLPHFESEEFDEVPTIVNQSENCE